VPSAIHFTAKGQGKTKKKRRGKENKRWPPPRHPVQSSTRSVQGSLDNTPRGPGKENRSEAKKKDHEPEGSAVRRDPRKDEEARKKRKARSAMNDTEKRGSHQGNGGPVVLRRKQPPTKAQSLLKQELGRRRSTRQGGVRSKQGREHVSLIKVARGKKKSEKD